MTERPKYFNSSEAANILGVNVSTIKRWTDDGKLKCIKTAGGHRKFAISHLAEFIQENKQKTSRVNVFPVEGEEDLEISYHITKGDFKILRKRVLEDALACNRERIHQILNGLYLGQFPLYVIYDKLITPVMHRIGDLWETEHITITEEHFASQIIRDSLIRLQSAMQIPSEKIGKALCLNLSQELHDIALKMVDHLLEIRGYKVLFSGQITPLYKLETIFSNFNPDRVYISSTVISEISLAQLEFNYLLELCEKNDAEVYIGGRGMDKLNIDHPAITALLESFKEVYET